MTSRFGLSLGDIEKLQSVLSRYVGIQKAVIYGSRAKGNYRASSDIDITLIGRLDWQTFNRLEMELDDLLLPYKIDLSIYDQIENNELKSHIQRVGKVLFSKQE
ncbi:nucleotidyltransferase domain-containing protein [Halomonas sp. TBZ9]|uniref:Nucleotidyltransferase domain-containing protein n=1 Tax=Vreelandella azerica TaxID=2732867 RepID=A0A7Y3TX85_9GAMM|nr:nucleotidyltransferase domain-containing protein [Halomonas azerica]NOG31638.1 nucleotidyltransferase domain-containing protein [Halomonas azerica]